MPGVPSSTGEIGIGSTSLVSGAGADERQTQTGWVSYLSQTVSSFVFRKRRAESREDEPLSKWRRQESQSSFLSFSLFQVSLFSFSWDNTKWKEKLYPFLLAKRRNPNVPFNAGPPLVSEFGLGFSLVGRGPTLVACQTVFTQVLEETSGDRNSHPVLAFVGLPGVGKTRMLHEWKRALPSSWKSSNTLELLITYNNGEAPTDTEITSGAPEATFAWRLLYRYFLSNNGPDLGSFMASAKNAFWYRFSGLTIKVALDLITEHHRRTYNLSENDTIVFIGLDEFQRTNKIKSLAGEPTPLRSIIDAIGGVMTRPPEHVRVLSMICGTEVLALSEKDTLRTPGITTSCYPVVQISLPFLEFQQAEGCIRQHPNSALAGFVAQDPIRRQLIKTAGLPRLFEIYLGNLMRISELEQPISFEPYLEAFKAVRDYVDRQFANLTQDVLLYVLAVAFARLPVKEGHIAIGNYTWADFQRVGLCDFLKIECEYGSRTTITMPLAVVHCCILPMLAKRGAFRRGERELLQSVDFLFSRAESYDQVEPWQLWERFGAAAWALKINALVYLGHETIDLASLLFGAKFDFELFKQTSVSLQPVSVVEMAQKCIPGLPNFVTHRTNSQLRYDWRTGGFVLINGLDGPGIDVLVYFPKGKEDTHEVVVGDQRKLSCNKLIPSFVNKVWTNAKGVLPVAAEAKYFIGIFNPHPTYPSVLKPPANCFLVCRSNIREFYGALAFHPAASTAISVNSPLVSQSMIQLHLRSSLTDKERDSIAKAIETGRIDWPFENKADLLARLSKVPGLASKIDEGLFDDWDCICFAPTPDLPNTE